MFKKLLLALGLVVSVSAGASTNINSLMSDISSAVLADVQAQSPFNWKVGDTASYKLNMGGFIQGKMVMTIKVVEPAKLVIAQDMDLGFAGKQSCEQTLNPNTGEVISIVCNGQQQQAGNQGDIEMIDSKEDTVTVPAGTFTCLYIKARNKADNSEVEQWVSPKEVPVFGMVKTIAPSQLGKVTVELTSFKRN